MELTVNTNPIVTYPGQSIGIERISPVLNDNAGSFSYPFTVPTSPNKVALGFPGRLSRKDPLPAATFQLKEQGLTIARGEVGYDGEAVGWQDTAIYLKSGNSEFYKIVENKKLADIDYGSEEFPANHDSSTVPSVADAELMAVFLRWTGSNIIDNGKYRCFPFLIKDDGRGSEAIINNIDYNSLINLTCTISPVFGTDSRHYCLQFKVAWMLERILNDAGYKVDENQLITSDYADLVIFGNILKLYVEWEYDNIEELWYRMVISPKLNGFLHYSYLMPEMNVIDFIELFQKMTGFALHFNETLKTVSIRMNKAIFSSTPKDIHSQTIDGKNGEPEADSGYTIEYEGQEDAIATESDYTIYATVADYASLPSIVAYNEGLVWHVTDTDRDYKLIKNESDVLEYSRVGRLKSVTVGNGKNSNSFNVKVPLQVLRDITFTGQRLSFPANLTADDCELPYLDIETSGDKLTDIGQVISLYRERVQYTATGDGGTVTIHFPTACWDKLSLDGTKDWEVSLAPDSLHNELLEEFLYWSNYGKIPVLRYFIMTLGEVLLLAWDERYLIDGVPVLIDKISFDLPYNGIMELRGYVCRR